MNAVNAEWSSSKSWKNSELVVEGGGRKRKSLDKNEIMKRSKKQKLDNNESDDEGEWDGQESSGSQNVKRAKSSRAGALNGVENESDLERRGGVKKKKKKGYLNNESSIESLGVVNNNEEEKTGTKKRKKKQAENQNEEEQASVKKKKKKAKLDEISATESDCELLSALRSIKTDPEPPPVSAIEEKRKQKKNKANKEDNATDKVVVPEKKSKKNNKSLINNMSLDGVNKPNGGGIAHHVNIIDIKKEQNNGDNENVVHISIKDDRVNFEENDLLNQLENKLTTTVKTKKEPINWPQADVQELIARIELCSPKNDTIPFQKRLEKLEWDTIAFKDYTVEQCKSTWCKLQKRIRKFRIMDEVLKDAKEWAETMYLKTEKKKEPKTVKRSVKASKTLKHPDMPRKPLTAYFIFYMQHRDLYQKEHPGTDAAVVSKVLAQQFTSLPPEKKKTYDEIAAKNWQEYKKKLDMFYETHPEVPRAIRRADKVKLPKVKSPKPVKVPKIAPAVKEKPVKVPAEKKTKEKIPVKPHIPFHYFYLSEAEKEKPDDKAKFKEMCKEKWKTLPERNKLVWIQYAETEAVKYQDEIDEYAKTHPDYVINHTKNFLSRQDLDIKDRAAGKPKKPPTSPYNIFAGRLLQSEDIKKVPRKDRLTYVADQWKLCTEEEKSQYREEFNNIRRKYKEEFDAYLETLTEEERQLELSKMTKKEISERGDNNKKVAVKKEPKATSGRKKQVQPAPESEVVERLKEPEQPPISPFKYFSSIYKGEEPVSQAWKALSKEQKKTYEEELDKKKRLYIQEFEKFLKSLSEKELTAFSLTRKRIKEEQENNEASNDDDDDDADSEEDSDDDEESSSSQDEN